MNNVIVSFLPNDEPILQMNLEFSLTMQDLVKNLRLAFTLFM